MARSTIRRQRPGPHEPAWLGSMGLAFATAIAFGACGSGPTLSGSGLGSTPSATSMAIVGTASPASPASTIETPSLRQLRSRWFLARSGSPSSGPEATGGTRSSSSGPTARGGISSSPTWPAKRATLTGHRMASASPSSIRRRLTAVSSGWWTLTGPTRGCSPHATFHATTFNYPDWAPDGGAIYHGLRQRRAGERAADDVRNRSLRHRSATHSTLLARKDGMAAEQPRISPDGTQVVYDRGALDGSGGLALYLRISWAAQSAG